MPNNVAQRRKKKAVRPAGFVLFNTSLGHGMTPPTPPDFGAAKYTANQQLEQPTEPFTRVLKDVLRVGKWKVYDKNDKPVMWDVTPSVLATLANTTKQRLASGDAVNFGKGHGDEDLIIEPDDLISPIDDIILSGGVLWVSSYVTPAQAEYLSNPARKVSVGVLEDYLAGDGQQYPMVLAHVAVTDRPIVTGQGRFLALANSYRGSSKMDFAALVEALNKLLGSMDLGSLPESVDETNIVVVIETMAAANGGGDVPADDPAAEGGDVNVAPDMAPEMANAAMGRYGMANRQNQNLAKTLSQLIDAKLKPVTDQLASLQSSKETDKQAAYDDAEKAAGKSGITAITLTNTRKLAMLPGPLHWDVRLLANLAPTLTMGGKAKTLANGSAPEVPGEGVKRATDDEVIARLKARGIDQKFMPKIV